MARDRDVYKFYNEEMDQEINLSFDQNRQDRSLRPWDGADEYLTKLVVTEYKHCKNIFILNDSTGCLSAMVGESCSRVLEDSYINRKTIDINRAQNKQGAVNFINLDQQGSFDKVDLVLCKAPKSLDSLSLLLDFARKSFKPGTPLLVSGLSKYLPKSFFEEYNVAVDGGGYSLIYKKARVYSGLLKEDKALFDISLHLSSFTEKGLNLSTFPGVFSKGKIDMGSSFLLDHFPRVDDPKLIVDPGCGCGVLGLSALKKWPLAKLIATDDSYSAILSTQESARLMALADRLETRFTNCLTGVESDIADLVICNPPFHAGQRVSMETGFFFLEESQRVLKEGGQLFFVANKHLGYKKKLDSLFPSSHMIIAQNSKFCIYMCRK